MMKWPVGKAKPRIQLPFASVNDSATKLLPKG
jgi:hypothetical protein